MWVRGIDLREVVKVEEGAEGIRVTFVGGDRKFVGGDAGREVLEGWRLMRVLGAQQGSQQGCGGER